MRIAYLINQYPKVSHSFIRREIVALEASGVEVDRIALRGWCDTLVDAADQRERARTRYVLRDPAQLLAAVALMALSHPLRLLLAFTLALKMASRSLRPLPVHVAYVVEACLVAKWLLEQEVTHVHAHFGTNSTEVAMLASLMADGQYSFTVHGPEEFDQPLSLGLAEKVKRCRFVVAVSSFGRSQLYRWTSARDWEKIKVVHCGIDDDFYGIMPVPIPLEPRLVCVGRLCEQKGQLLLVRATRVLRSRGILVTLVLAGDGEQRAEIEAEIHALGLSEQVSITGWINSEQVRSEILAARALVLPSFAEGLPVVLMEALASRRPVLSTFVAGIPELVQHGVNGWLFPSGSVDGLAAAMEECLRAPTELLEQMGHNGRQRVLERHDIARETRKLSDLFTESVAKPVPVLVS
jgi:colanic acid/amylovoran biosynthesis glycosyltransferase